MSKNIMSENEETSKDSPDGSSSAPRAGILRLWGLLGRKRPKPEETETASKEVVLGKNGKPLFRSRIVKRS